MIGSIRLASNATILVSGEPCIVAAGYYYLYDADDDLSLIKQVEAAIETVLPGVVSVYVRRDRKVQIDFAGGNTATLQFPDTLAVPLGFGTTELAEAGTFTGSAVPALLWSPAWGETTEGSPVGVAGRKIHDRIMKSSPSGLSTFVTTHHYTREVTASWFAVRPDRAWTPAEAPGEFVDFFDRVIVPGRNMKLYSGVTEDEASSTAVTWPTPLGPYDVPDPPYDWYRRFVPNSDSLGANISFTMKITGEYE